MGFRFNLQRVLEMRGDAEKAAGRIFDEASAACAKLRALLQDELSSYFEEREIFNDAARETRLCELPSLERSLEARKRRLLEVMTALKEAESDMRIAEQALILARRDLKAVENLKERREDDWRRKEALKERKQLDELATQRHARKA